MAFFDKLKDAANSAKDAASAAKEKAQELSLQFFRDIDDSE